MVCVGRLESESSEAELAETKTSRPALRTMLYRLMLHNAFIGDFIAPLTVYGNHCVLRPTGRSLATPDSSRGGSMLSFSSQMLRTKQFALALKLNMHRKTLPPLRICTWPTQQLQEVMVS